MHVELALWEAGLLYFSARSRGQLKAHMLIHHHLLPGRNRPPILYRMQCRQNPPCAAECKLEMESFLCHQLVRQVTFQERKQEQNSAAPHCVDAHAKVLAGIRWAHKHQVLSVWPLASLGRKRMRDYLLKVWHLLMTNWKHRTELKVPLSPDRLSKLEGIH